MMPLLLIFDLDGTLVDSREDLAASVNLARSDFGLSPMSVEDVSKLIGDGVHSLIARAFAGHQVDINRAVARMKAHYEIRMFDRTKLYPGVEQGLSDLRDAGHVMALVSNKIVSACEAILRHFGLFSLFKVVLGGDSLQNLKPHPQPVLEAMRRTGFAPSGTWMIGDHFTDIEAGRAAGARTAFVTYGIGRVDGATPDRCFEGFDELAACFVGAEL